MKIKKHSRQVGEKFVAKFTAVLGYKAMTHAMSSSQSSAQLFLWKSIAQLQTWPST